MKKPAIWISILVTIMSILSPFVCAAYHYADSPEFALNLLSFPLGAVCDYADSLQFNLNLYPTNRASADADFPFNYLANSDPALGDYMTPAHLPQNGVLRQFAAAGGWVDPFEPPPGPGDIVFILNHGWNGSPETGAVTSTLAPLITQKFPEAFIYAWDWGDGPNTPSPANPNGKDTPWDFAPLAGCTLGPARCVLGFADTLTEVQQAHTNARTHGWLLGNALYNIGIRPDVQRIHMIGHSFGGVVSAKAADVLYSRSGNKPIDQITTLDTPAMIVPYAIGAVNPKHYKRTEVIYYDWTLALAFGATGGPVLNPDDRTLNLMLSPSQHDNPWVLHTRVVDWYVESVNAFADCDGDTPYGFRWSFAFDPDPLTSDPPTGFYAEFAPDAADRGCIFNVPEAVKQAVETVVEVAKETFDSAAQWVGNKAEIVIDTTKKIVNSAVKLALTATLPLSKAGPLTDPNQPEEAYIYRTLTVPADARSLTFDYRFQTVSPGDILTLSIEDKVLIILDAQVEGVSEEYRHALPVNITAFAGSEVLLQIALRPTGGGESSVLIDNIAFITRTIPGDIDGDLYVGLSDLTLIADNWLELGLAPTADIAPPAGDGTVNMHDFATLTKNWQIDITDPNTP